MMNESLLVEVILINHPLCSDRLRILRDKTTTSPSFRAALQDISHFLIYESARNLSTDFHDVYTPVGQTVGESISSSIIFIPILRAGLGMLEAAHALIPTAEVGFVGAVRDENDLRASVYWRSLPSDLSAWNIYVLDPMVATGNSMSSTLKLLVEYGAKNITVISVLATQQGINAIACFPQVSSIYVAAIDAKLNDEGYIYPGLGDAGDRQYGILSAK